MEQAEPPTTDSNIKRVDELLVCAAVACRAGEFGGVPTACARAMGKTISKPKLVIEWVARLEKLEQAPASESDSGLLVQPAWIEQHVPGIRELTVAPMVISPGKHHGTRSIDAVSSTPLGSTRATSTTVDYTLPPSQGERASEGKRHAERHWHREVNKVRSLDLSGAAEEITFAMTKVTTKVTTTSRSAVTNLMRNLTTTQSMSTTQMTHTDADAHSFCCPVSHVFCAKERALLPPG